MPERLDAGRLLIALGALALLISLFLDWYGPGNGAVGNDVTAWGAFEFVDLLLAALAIVALAAVIGAAIPAAALPAPPASTLTVLGPIAFVLVLVSLLDDPPAVIGSSPETGLWVAFAGSALMTIGALLSVARISLTIAVRERDATRSPGGSDRAADTETRPLPPRDGG